jgi:hypothetical protein
MLVRRGVAGSIHQVGSQLSGGAPCNGWTQWFYLDEAGSMQPIDVLRQELRKSYPSDGSLPES